MISNERIRQFQIPPQCSIKDALKHMDVAGQKILFVTDKQNRLAGVVSDGDLRRYILRNGTLTGSISSCINKKPVFIKHSDPVSYAKKIMLDKKIEILPVLDDRRQIIDIYFWNELFSEGALKVAGKINLPVVIMAGGKGERLAPFTNILPKPLIPIGEKPVLETIMDKFHTQGAQEFHVTVNYKAEMIKSYFDNITVPYKIIYIRENKFLGTGGSLKLLPKNIPSPIIVSNCDIIIEANYTDIVEYHRENKNDITLVGAVQRHVIPYGVIGFSRKGAIKKITEKPEFHFTVNTGFYILEKPVLKHIPAGVVFHITDLIDKCMKAGLKVGMYPISEKSYVDIGQWEEYRKSVSRLGL